MLVSLVCLFLPSSLFIFSFKVLFSRKKNILLVHPGVHLHSHSQWMPFTQAASLRQADKEMDSRESLKRLSLVAETLNRKSRSKRGQNWPKRQQSCRRNRQVVLPLLDSAKEPNTCQSLRFLFYLFYWRGGFQSISQNSNLISIRKHRDQAFLRRIFIPWHGSRITMLHADVPTFWAYVKGKPG